MANFMHYHEDTFLLKQIQIISAVNYKRQRPGTTL